MISLQSPPKPMRSPQRGQQVAKEHPRARDLSVDTLRGIAILTMMAANLAAPLLADPHPLALRVCGSFSAPIFVTLAGMMVAWGARQRRHSLWHYAVRGAGLVFAAALLDMLLWRAYPFLTVDVLYLLGVALPLAYGALRMSRATRWLVITTILLATPVLQLILGYAHYPQEIPLTRAAHDGLDAAEGINHWLVDGWFPLFPWAGFAVYGVQLAESRSRQLQNHHRATPRACWWGLLLMATGVIVWWAFPGAMLVRAGYSELFYPPTLGFVLTAAGAVTFLLGTIDRWPNLAIYRPLQILGGSALTVYVLHLVFIQALARRLGSPLDFGGFVTTYAGLSAAMFAIAWLRRFGVRLKRNAVGLATANVAAIGRY